MLNDNIDMAVMNLPRVMNYTKLSCETIFEEPILLAASTEHPVIQELLNHCEYKGKYPVAPAEILNQLPILMTKPGQNLTIQISYFLAKNQIPKRITALIRLLPPYHHSRKTVSAISAGRLQSCQRRPPESLHIHNS